MGKLSTVDNPAMRIPSVEDAMKGNALDRIVRNERISSSPWTVFLVEFEFESEFESEFVHLLLGRT